MSARAVVLDIGGVLVRERPKAYIPVWEERPTPPDGHAVQQLRGRAET